MKAGGARVSTIIAGVVITAGVAIITSNGGASRIDVRGREEAELQVRSELRAAETVYGPDSPQAGAAAWHLAELLLTNPRANLAEGAALALRALAIKESNPGTQDPELVRALETLAMWQWHAGDYGSERPVVERALAIRESTVPQDEAWIASDLHLLAEIFRVEGDYGRALQLRERIGPIIERIYGPEHEQLAVHLHYLAALQAAIGDINAAAVNVRRAVGIRERVLSATDPRLARSLNLLGGLLIEAGELDKAQPLLERARTIWEASGSRDQTDTALALTHLARLFAARGGDEHAAQILQSVVAIRSAAFGSNHPLVARTLSELGAIERRRGDREAARKSLRRALEIQKHSSVPSFPEWAETLRELSLLDGSDGRLDAALREALDAEQRAREHFRESAVGLSEREALTQARGRLGGVDLAWVWASKLASQGLLQATAASELLDQAIRSRALVLDTLATRQRILALHQDEETTVRVDTLRRARQRLTHLLMEGPASQAEVEPSIQLTQARAAADRAERDLAEKSREYRRERGRGDTGLDAVCRALPPRSALVSYIRYDGAYAAAVLTGSAEPPRIVPLGSAADIERSVRAWGDCVSHDPRPKGVATSEAEYLEMARTLAGKIWDPIAPFVDGVEHVFVVPDGAVHRVNLATLVTRNGEYLVESGISFHYLTAERDLVGGTEQTARGRGLLALGDPAFGVPRGQVARRFDPIPGSRQEAIDVASLWSGRDRTKILTGEEADESNFKRLAPSYRVLHLATHAYFETGSSPGDSPLRVAGLAMARANRSLLPSESADAEDGVLTAEEIGLLDLRGVEWAVLSACASGQGALEPGEGILGLRRAFQIAGVRTLVVSLWPVEDDATRHWMRALYEARNAGQPTAEALRNASLGILNDQRRAGGTTHPYFWGGFVSVGDWR